MKTTAIFTILLTALAARAEFPLNPDSNLDQTLDALDKVGRDLKDFSADVSLGSIDPRTGEKSEQIGRVVFQKYQNKDGQEDTRIRVTFKQKKLEDGTTLKKELDYKLEDGWLNDRDFDKKLEVRRQVLRPGQKMDLLKLGEGPFPLPIGQDKDTVKQEFEASKVDSKPEDPKDTIHIKLVPKKGSQLEKRFKQLDVYVDQKTGMPKRIEALEKAGTTRTTDLKDLKLNGGVKADEFKLEDISGQNWNRREEPYQ